MTIQLINLGTYANDGTGDDLRTAFLKVNQNFVELDNLAASNGANLGSGAGVFAGKVNDTLNFKSLIAGNNLNLVSSANSITISVNDFISELVQDTNPKLGGDLDLNQYNLSSTSSISISTNSTIELVAKDEFTNNYNEITLNKLLITGNNSNVDGDTIISSQENNGLIIEGPAGLTLVSENIFFDGPVTSTNSITAPIFIGTTEGTHNGNVTGNVTGNLTGTVTGNVNGNVTGNVTGTVSDLSNHILSDLLDVSVALPSVGQALLWSGSEWIPGSIQPEETTTNQSYDLGTISEPSTDVLNFGTFLVPNELLTVDGNLGNAYIIENIAISNSNISSLGASSLGLTSSNDINLNSPTAVVVTQGSFRLATFTTSERDNLNSNYGDMIYNSEENKFQGYVKDAGGVGVDGWVNLH